MPIMRMGREDMRAITSETPVPLAAVPAPALPEREEPRRAGSARVFIFAGALALFWMGAGAAYLWGYLGLPGILALGTPTIAVIAAAMILPPFLCIAIAFTFVRTRALANSAEALAAASDRLYAVDESAASTAQQLGRSVRRELDALNTGLDGAFNRLRALETALEERVAQLDAAGARAAVKAENIAQRLHSETEAIDASMSAIERVTTQSAETITGRSAQLQAMIESATGELKAASQTLDAQSAQFRESAERAASAPQTAAVELDRQARHIETAAETMVARAEFVLARQERQRAALSEMLTKLKEEASSFEQVLEAQRTAVERAASSLAGEAQRLDELTDQGFRRIDGAMASANTRAAQFASGYAREAERVKETTEATGAAMMRLVESLREAGTSAQSLMIDSTEQAKKRQMDIVGEAMAQCDQLLRAASSVAEQAEKARTVLARAAEDAQRHIVALPGIAAQEAQRVRETVRQETDQLLDVSARALSSMRNHTHLRREVSPDKPAGPQATQDSLRVFARRVSKGTKRKDDAPARSPGRFELSDVLAAAEGVNAPQLRPSAAASLGALEMVLADLAIDLNSLLADGDDAQMWRRYLNGDRGAFARALAQTISPQTVDRISALYRDNGPFREAATAYLSDFQTLLAGARESDRDGFLASTLLSADTGKIYLAIAYALGRLD